MPHEEHKPKSTNNLPPKDNAQHGKSQKTNKTPSTSTHKQTTQR